MMERELIERSCDYERCAHKKSVNPKEFGGGFRGWYKLIFNEGNHDPRTDGYVKHFCSPGCLQAFVNSFVEVKNEPE